MLLKVNPRSAEEIGRQLTAAQALLCKRAGAATDIRLFKACCNPSSIPERLGPKRVHGGNVDVAHDAVVSRGIRAAMGCQRSPAVTRGGPHGSLGDAAHRSVGPKVGRSLKTAISE